MKISLVAAVTLDGKIAKVENQTSLEWTSKEDKAFFVRKTKEAGVLIMGRTTYNTIGKPLPGRLNIVMTRDASKQELLPDVLEYTSESPQEIIKNLQARGFEEVIIAGGSSIYSQFIQSGLVTDYYLTFEPILFGKGIGLAEDIQPKKLTFVSMERLGEQSVLLHYKA